MNPDEIRAAFNVQHFNHGSTQWVRLNLSAGPVLARRHTMHHSSPIYVVVLNNGTVRHWMVTINCQLKSNGISNLSPEIERTWRTLIGYTEEEYTAAKAKGETDRTRLYERGPQLAA